MGVVEEAAAAIQAGSLVVLPTDTVYGLAASPENADAVGRLSALKRRPDGMPLAIEKIASRPRMIFVAGPPPVIISMALCGAPTRICASTFNDSSLFLR